MTDAKKYRSILLIAGVLIAFSAVYGYFSILRTPRIEVTPAFMDLGDVTEEGFNYTFTVRNTGSKDLVIDRVSTSCGCTSATIDSERIMPGGETGLRVTFNPKLMVNEEIKGKVSRIIFIRSNDPEKPELEIKITANVVEG